MEKKKKLTCGALIFYKNKMLICRPRWDSEIWNLPKGVKEDNETTLDAAIREIKEETNILINEEDIVIDIGKQPYLKKKDIYLYVIILKNEPNDLKCNSFFERDGKQFPEMVDYKWINPQERGPYFSEKLNKSLNKVFEDKKCQLELLKEQHKK